MISRAQFNYAPLDKAAIDLLARGAHPQQAELERELVMRARAGDTKGMVAKPARYSATTIQWWMDCERLFYWPTIAGLESPPSPAQEFGTKLHKFQEDYLNGKGLPPRTSPEGHLANIGLPLLPRPGAPGLYVEEPFEMQFDGLPVAITGTKDFGVDPVELDAKGFLLGDHKTASTANPRNPKWKKDKAWLHGNVQSNLYAFTKWADLHARGFTSLTLVDKQWIYYFKAEKQAEKLRVVDSLDHVGEQFETVIKPAVIGMARMVREMPRIGDVALPKDPDTCNSYGGCVHRARCFGFGMQSPAMGPGASKFSKANIQRASLSVVEESGINNSHPAGATKEEKNMGMLAGKFTKAAITAKAVGASGAGTAINPPKPKAAPVQLVQETVEEEDLGEDQTALSEEIVEQEEAPAPKAKKTAKPKGAEKLVEETAAKLDKAFAKSARTPGSNPDHNYWLLSGGVQVTKGATATPIPVDDLLGTAQAIAMTMTEKEHYRMEFGGHALLETAFTKWMEENAIVGVISVPAQLSPGAVNVIGLLRAHASLVVE